MKQAFTEFLSRVGQTTIYLMTTINSKINYEIKIFPTLLNRFPVLSILWFDKIKFVKKIRGVPSDIWRESASTSMSSDSEKNMSA